MIDQSTRLSRARRARPFGALGLAFVMALGTLLFTVDGRAGSIFDDDWVPPQRMQPAAPKPATPPTLTPTPASLPATVPANPPAIAPAAPAVPMLPLPIPAKAEVGRSRKAMTEIFAPELADHSVRARRALGRKLLEEAAKYEASPVDKYVVLSGAISAAEEGGDLRTCFTAADALGATFQIDAEDVKVNAAMKMPAAAYAADAAENVKAALEVLDRLVVAEDYLAASRLGYLLQPIAAGDVGLNHLVQQHRKDVEAMRSAHDRIAASLEKLESNADDPAANLAVGSYYCFAAEKWDRGLPMLAKGSDPVLRSLATSELGKPSSRSLPADVGDGWWDVGAERTGLAHYHICRHAAALYALARGSLTGLHRAVIEKRLLEAAAMEGRIDPLSGGLPSSFTNTLGMKLILLKPGTFLMGSPAGEQDRRPNEQQHKVMLTNPFYIAATLVTHAQWKKVMGSNPSRFEGDQNPVEQISWRAAVEFCEKLSKIEGKRYRLPTEAEWEYACRAGSTDAYGASNPEDVGWYSSNSEGHTHPVGQKKPNAWGLYDMHGNIFEWCNDRYSAYTAEDAVDPTGPKPDGNLAHIMRSGSWSEPPKDARGGTVGIPAVEGNRPRGVQGVLRFLK